MYILRNRNNFCYSLLIPIKDPKWSKCIPIGTDKSLYASPTQSPGTNIWQSVEGCRFCSWSAFVFSHSFRVRHSRGEMYIGHARLCVCVSACPEPHPDVILGNDSECPIVAYCWADLQSVHMFCCYGSIDVRTQYYIGRRFNANPYRSTLVLFEQLPVKVQYSLNCAECEMIASALYSLYGWLTTAVPVNTWLVITIRTETCSIYGIVVTHQSSFKILLYTHC